jgi:hypothetical protein
MKNAVLVRVMDRACDLRDEFHRATDWHRLAPDHVVKLAALDEVHAEVAVAVALADFVNWDNAWMVEAGGRFRFETKTLQVRFRGPLAQADHFECDGAVEAFLSRAVNYALATSADFLQQFVVAKISKHLWAPRDGLAVASRSRSFFSVCCSRSLIVSGVIRLRRGYGGQVDLGHRFVREQTKAGLEQASRAGSLPCVSRNFRPALSANLGGSLH